MAAVRQAIADWDYALRQEFGGLITLTDVTTEYTAKHKADIVLYNPTSGGTVFSGYAICGEHKCPNVIVAPTCRRASVSTRTRRSTSTT